MGALRPNLGSSAADRQLRTARTISFSVRSSPPRGSSQRLPPEVMANSKCEVAQQIVITYVTGGMKYHVLLKM